MDSAAQAAAAAEVMDNVVEQPQEPQPQLKQIDFVRNASLKAIEKAAELAEKAASYAPGPVAGAATSVYERVAPTLKPYAEKTLEFATPRAEAALVVVDTKVDAVVTSAKGFYNKNYEIAAARYNTLQTMIADGKNFLESASDEYFKLIDGSLKAVAGKLKEAASIDAAALVSAKVEELKGMLKNVREINAKEKLMQQFSQLQSLWESLLSRKEVANLLEYSGSSAKSLIARADGIHDIIVANPRYSTLLDAADSWVKWAQATSVGSTITSYVTPYAERLAQTSYAEAAAPYASRIINYWKPEAALEGITTK